MKPIMLRCVSIEGSCMEGGNEETYVECIPQESFVIIAEPFSVFQEGLGNKVVTVVVTQNRRYAVKESIIEIADLVWAAQVQK